MTMTKCHTAGRRGNTRSALWPSSVVSGGLCDVYMYISGIKYVSEIRTTGYPPQHGIYPTPTPGAHPSAPLCTPLVQLVTELVRSHASRFLGTRGTLALSCSRLSTPRLSVVEGPGPYHGPCRPSLCPCLCLCLCSLPLSPPAAAYAAVHPPPPAPREAIARSASRSASRAPSSAPPRPPAPRRSCLRGPPPGRNLLPPAKWCTL